MKRLSFVAVLMLICGAGQQALASGFQIPEQGAKAMGLANAFTAVADDPSATWYNPAAIAFLDGSQLMLGGNIIILPGTDFTANASNPATTGRVVGSASKTIFSPQAYLTYKPEGWRLAFGIGLNAPFGLETDWPATGAFASKNTFSRLNMFSVNPNVAFQINDNLSFAAGFSYYNAFNVNFDSSTQLLDADGDGWGGNAALLYRGDPFSFGVTYRSRVKVSLSGLATSAGALAGLGAGTSAATSKITFPDMVNIGAAFSPDPRWTLSAEVDWVNWKTFDAIRIQYASATYLAAVNTLRAALGGAAVTQTTIPENWKAKFAFRAGVEWNYRSNMRARFGYTFDPTPVRDVDFSPAIPDSDRHLFAVGYGYDVTEDATIDVAYMFVYFTDRNQTASPTGDLPLSPNTVKNGLYESLAHLVGINVTWRF